MSSLTIDQKAQLKDALFDGLKLEIHAHLHNYVVQKLSDQKNVMAEHHRKGLHFILDVYETAHDILDEILDNYR